MNGLAMRRNSPILTEPFQVPDIFITGMETPFVHMDFARLVFWTDHPPVFGGDDPVIERQVACKLVMTKVTFAMVRRLIAQSRDGG